MITDSLVGSSLIPPQPGSGTPAHLWLIAAEPAFITSDDSCLESGCMPESCQQVSCHSGMAVSLSLGQQMRNPLGWSLAKVEAVLEGVVNCAQ